MPPAGCLIPELTPENVTLVVRNDKRCNKLVVRFQNTFTRRYWMCTNPPRHQFGHGKPLPHDIMSVKATQNLTTGLRDLAPLLVKVIQNPINVGLC
jgi:hypothetical protein